MSAEFHYPPGARQVLKRLLPIHPYPRKKFLSEYRPPGITEDGWNAIDYDDEDSPRKIKVWVDASTRQEITPIPKSSGPHISARELFLESMRQHIQETITLREEGMYLTSGKIRGHLEDCDKEFSGLLDYVAELPYLIQCELDTNQLAALKKILRKLVKSTRAPYKDPPEYRLPPNIFREDFLGLMLREYRKFFGDLPNHTRGQPFNTVAEKLCDFTEFSSQGMEDALAKAKAKLT